MTEFNAKRVVHAAQEIERLSRAYGWISTYGKALSHRDHKSFLIAFEAIDSSACVGSREAEVQLTAIAATLIQDIVAAALRDAENTIELHKEAIREEVGALK